MQKGCSIRNCSFFFLPSPSLFARAHIVWYQYEASEKAADPKKRDEYTKAAFEMFDRFGNFLIDIFEQFGINQTISRNGFAPRQDPAIMASLYGPAMALLADPKWRN